MSQVKVPSFWLSIVIGRCKKQDPIALHETQQQLNALTQEFDSEIKRFEKLSKKKEFKDKQINFVVQFHPKITISNPISVKLAELIETYDRLIAILKLLRLTSCFETDKIYFINMKKKQKLTNKILSKVILG